MIYTGDYLSNKIYGTENNHSITVKTENNATFLICQLDVLFNGEVWSHPFEIPFFDNIASFYFGNFIHSIITQKFIMPNLDCNTFNYLDFDLAQVTMTLKEMDNETELSSLSHSFFMILGKFQTQDVTAFTPTYNYILENEIPEFVTPNALISCSFLSTNFPLKLLINSSETTREINLIQPSTTKLLHTIIIPVKEIVSLTTSALTLSFEFPNNIILNIASINVIDKGIDHNLIAFQNQFGSISVLEFNGELKINNQFKYDDFETRSNNINSINVSEITYNETYTLNTGYWLDVIKYKLLKRTLKSFNIFLFQTTWLKIILSKTTTITPYKTNFYQNNESLIFKLSENDNPIYRTF
ncbi:hypothetical protein [Algibacter sp. PT7-4]|uniref:hypothetical protein n=1 Tax=Algibacter ulvanivorans TaxID=3400999 RepID=UPI003AAA3683